MSIQQLFSCIEEEDTKQIEAQLQSCEDIHVTDPTTGHNALFYAVGTSNLDIVKLVCEYRRKPSSSSSSSSPSSDADDDDEDVQQIDVAHIALDGNNAIMWLVENTSESNSNDVAIFSYLLSVPHVSLLPTNASGDNLLHILLRAHNEQLWKCVVGLPVARLPSFQCVHPISKQPFSHLCYSHPPTFSYLLSQHKLDINAQDKDGYTLPMRVVEDGVELEEWKKLLALPGLDLTLTTQSGQSLLHILVNEGNKELLAYTVGINGVKTVINAGDKERGWTPLMYAVSKDQSPLVSLFLSLKSIDVNIQDKRGWNIAHLAARFSHKAIALLSSYYKLFIARDRAGITPITQLCIQCQSAEADKIFSSLPDVELNEEVLSSLLYQLCNLAPGTGDGDEDNAPAPTQSPIDLKGVSRLLESTLQRAQLLAPLAIHKIQGDKTCWSIVRERKCAALDTILAKYVSLSPPIPPTLLSLSSLPTSCSIRIAPPLNYTYLQEGTIEGAKGKSKAGETSVQYEVQWEVHSDPSAQEESKQEANNGSAAATKAKKIEKNNKGKENERSEGTNKTAASSKSSSDSTSKPKKPTTSTSASTPASKKPAAAAAGQEKEKKSKEEEKSKVNKTPTSPSKSNTPLSPSTLLTSNLLIHLPSLLPGTLYTIRIRSKIGKKASAWGELGSVRIGCPVPPLLLLSSSRADATFCSASFQPGQSQDLVSPALAGQTQTQEQESSGGSKCVYHVELFYSDPDSNNSTSRSSSSKPPQLYKSYMSLSSPITFPRPPNVLSAYSMTLYAANAYGRSSSTRPISLSQLPGANTPTNPSAASTSTSATASNTGSSGEIGELVRMQDDLDRSDIAEASSLFTSLLPRGPLSHLHIQQVYRVQSAQSKAEFQAYTQFLSLSGVSKAELGEQTALLGLSPLHLRHLPQHGILPFSHPLMIQKSRGSIGNEGISGGGGISTASLIAVQQRLDFSVLDKGRQPDAITGPGAGAGVQVIAAAGEYSCICICKIRIGRVRVVEKGEDVASILSSPSSPFFSSLSVSSSTGSTVLLLLSSAQILPLYVVQVRMPGSGGNEQQEQNELLSPIDPSPPSPTSSSPPPSSQYAIFRRLGNAPRGGDMAPGELPEEEDMGGIGKNVSKSTSAYNSENEDEGIPRQRVDISTAKSALLGPIAKTGPNSSKLRR